AGARLGRGRHGAPRARRTGGWGVPEILEERGKGRRRDHAEAADRGLPHRSVELKDELLRLADGPGRSGGPEQLAGEGEQLLRADPAGDALPAGLPAVEFEAVEGLAGHVDVISVDNQARAEHQAEFAEVARVELEVEHVKVAGSPGNSGRQEAARRPRC